MNATPLTPVVGVFMVMSLLGALVVQLDPQGLLWQYLLYMPTDYQSAADSHGHQYWRMLTPIFLHFGLAHIVFNCLLLWILGSAVERSVGSTRLLILLMIAGVFSNVVQYQYTAYPLFGGLSGALYGVIGYIIVWNAFTTYRKVPVPPALLWLAIISMLLGFLGILSYILGGKVANAAHLGGFISGLVIALLDVLLVRISRTLSF